MLFYYGGNKQRTGTYTVMYVPVCIVLLNAAEEQHYYLCRQYAQEHAQRIYR